MKHKNRIALMVVAAVYFGLTSAPMASAESSQPQATTGARHVRHSQPRVPQSKPAVPQTTCDYDRAAGRCMIDLGYGRCMECSAGPFN